MCWVNPHGFPGTAGTPVPMTDSLTTRTNRIQNHAPHIGVHTAVYPPVGNFWCATIHCSSEPRSCSMQIRDCQEQRRTLRARRHALRIHELIRLHVRLPESYGILPESMDTLRSAAHSVIAIFRSAAKGSDRRISGRIPVLTFKLIITEILQRSRIHIFVQTHSILSSNVETQARKDRAFQTGHAAN